MKKSTIWVLTIIMALTFAGLLYVQFTYMANIKKMRDDQFEEGVKRSLYSVSTQLEQNEAKYYLEEGIQNYNAQTGASRRSVGSTGMNYNITSTEGINYDLSLKKKLSKKNKDVTSSGSAPSGASMREIMRGKYLYQKGMLDEVIFNIISNSSDRPIAERADSSEVRAYLRSELDNNGLTLPFEFAVVNRVGATIYKSELYNTDGVDESSIFVQTLFPNDPKNKMYYMKVYFPTKSEYIFDSVRFIIPSFIFTFILLVTFVFTIILAFRQKKLTEMKNDFINNMTHEFKTPISTISLAAQMLNDKSVFKSPNVLDHISSVIIEETKRLRFQVEKVLQMSMFDRQKASLKLVDVDANQLITGIISNFKLKVEKYGGKIEADLKAMKSTVKVDEMHFTNVIYNLLDNAVKYRKDDVPLRLRVSTGNTGSHGNERLVITVADNGIGIKRDDLKKIFERFYRVSTGNVHNVKGFGLGLAYVKKMVGELGGEITVESELGTGTRFTIVLPVNKE